MDLMQQFAREEDKLVLLRNDWLVVPVADVGALMQACVVNPQFATFELPRFAMEEIDERQMTRSHGCTSVVAVKLEEVPVFAGGYLSLKASDVECLHVEFFKYLRQNRFDAIEDQNLMLSQIEQDPGTPVLVIDDAFFCNR